MKYNMSQIYLPAQLFIYLVRCLALNAKVSRPELVGGRGLQVILLEQSFTIFAACVSLHV